MNPSILVMQKRTVITSKKPTWLKPAANRVEDNQSRMVGAGVTYYALSLFDVDPRYSRAVLDYDSGTWFLETDDWTVDFTEVHY